MKHEMCITTRYYLSHNFVAIYALYIFQLVGKCQEQKELIAKNKDVNIKIDFLF